MGLSSVPHLHRLNLPTVLPNTKLLQGAYVEPLETIMEGE